MAAIDKWFEYMLEHGGSDLILAEGHPPKLRLAGRIRGVEVPKLASAELTKLLKEICPADKWKSFGKTGDLDFAYSLGEKARFRANYYRHLGGTGAVFRIIPSKILTMDDLNLLQPIRDMARLRSGLVLVTGPTGSGKSTTLAAMIDAINTAECQHILTVEEPIEFIHAPKRSIIVQREVGSDVHTFADALRAASRMDVNVILVGEMRDYDTVSLAIAAAEKGLLVFGTLHTNSAAKTIDRIIDIFPSEEQEGVRKSLTVVLKGVCSQILCKHADGAGRVAVHEILIQTPALSNIIREGSTSKIVSVIQSGKALGMQLLDDALEARRKEGAITGREAYMRALDKTRFEAFAGGK